MSVGDKQVLRASEVIWEVLCLSFWHCKPTSYKIVTHVQWWYLVNLGLTVKVKHGSMFLTRWTTWLYSKSYQKSTPNLPKTDISEILSVHNHFPCCSILAKFCSMHHSRTAVLYAQFCNGWANQKVVMFATQFAFKLDIRRILQLPLFFKTPNYFFDSLPLYYLAGEHSGHFEYRLSQWEDTLRCNAFFHWRSPYPEWYLEQRLETPCIALGHDRSHYNFCPLSIKRVFFSK